MTEKKKIFIVMLMALGILVIATGTTYAFLSLAETGTQVASTKSAIVKLHYDEKDMQGIAITNALPMTDTEGKKENYFEFKVTGQTTSTPLTYYITARKQGNSASRIPEENIRIYLTNVSGTGQTATEPDTLLLDDYSNLTNLMQNGHEEQLLYTGTIAQNSTYDQDFRLRLWIKNDADFTPVVQGGETIYPMEDKTFSIKVNVYTEINEVAASCDYAFNLVGEGKQALEIGDEVYIDNEHFYVINTSTNNTTLIAKNRLALLGYATPSGSIGGLQLQENYNEQTSTIMFSHTNYWAGTSNLNNIYDSTKNTAPTLISSQCDLPWDEISRQPNCYIRMDDNSSDNYSVAYYVEDYGARLTQKGATVNKARLLTIDELDAMNTAADYIYIDVESFWSGSAKDDNTVYKIVKNYYDETTWEYYEGFNAVAVSYNYNGLPHGDTEFDIHGTSFNPEVQGVDWDSWKTSVVPVIEVPTCSIDLTGE